MAGGVLASHPFRSPSPGARPAVEPSSRQQGAPKRPRVGGLESRAVVRPSRSWDQGCRSPSCRTRGSGTRPSRNPGPGAPARSPFRSATFPVGACPEALAPRGRGLEELPGAGVRAGAAAGAAGTGLAPAAAEGAPRAGDVSAALSAGETRRPGAAGCGLRRGRSRRGPGAAPGRCPACSGCGGAGASAPGQSGGPAGGVDWSRGRAGSGGPRHLLGPGVRPRGVLTVFGPEFGCLWQGRGSRTAPCPELSSLYPRRLGNPSFRALGPCGRSPFVRVAEWLKPLGNRAEEWSRPCWWLQPSPCPTPPPFFR